MQRLLSQQAQLPFTYAPTGATATTPPAGYVVDHTRVILGEGEQCFESAKTALRRWDHFRLGWVQTWPPNVPLRDGEVVAVVARKMCLWWLNTCRIVYTVDESGPLCKFGFAYGTLPEHAESGEERFLVQWDRQTGDVWYDILAFSRPHQLLPRLAYPLLRRIQKQFGRDSAAAMRRAVTQ
jgi:uncharacterized protein (UPF0548 family)